MSILIKKLRDQHQLILELLNKPEHASELIHFVENEHHPLEENELFPLVADQQFLRQGGPRCSYFMGLRLDTEMTRDNRALLNRFYLKTDYRPCPYPVPAWLSPQNPLSIPMEEHIIGAEFAGCITFLLNQTSSSLYNEFFEPLYDSYCRLIMLHIDKEDNCLFVMCERHLSPG